MCYYAQLLLNGDNYANEVIDEAIKYNKMAVQCGNQKTLDIYKVLAQNEKIIEDD